MTPPLAQLKTWARTLKREVLALWFASKHPEIPWLAKALALLVVGYAFSPIDLIPDFIPVLGLLDDVLLLPLGIWLALKLIPDAVLVESRRAAEQWLMESREKPKSMAAAALIVLVWLMLLVLCLALFWPRAEAIF